MKGMENGARCSADRTEEARGADASLANGKADVGVVGLAVMGQNLVLNMADRGYRVAVFNRTLATMEEFVRKAHAAGYGARVVPARSIAELVETLSTPRRIVLMVRAGAAVDDTIEQLAQVLEPGDVVADCGNSHFRDTVRRQRTLEELGLRYLGVGVSGGEEGARRGPSIMAGGDPEGWSLLRDVFVDISAKAREDGKACASYMGPGGAGHFVKMVHNGIEYADMQLIAEAYHLMRKVCGLGVAEAADVFDEWNRGELESYLIEAAADVLRRVDAETGRPLVEVILDEAEQKGTGKWTSLESLDLGVPAPTIAEAVFARFVSALKGERELASRCLAGPWPEAQVEEDAVERGACSGPAPNDGAGLGGRPGGDERDAMRITLGHIEQALYASKICSYAQGFALLRQASVEYGWKLDLATVARTWRAGCIIRARFLDRVAEAFRRDPDLCNLLLGEEFRRVVALAQRAWRKVVSAAVLRGLPVPAMGSALAWYDSYRCEHLPANLIQAQRDYFGAHTYRRVDRPGSFHTQWKPGV
ncbi:MAG: NADP-dependent phosphogluconate dehydrogenase [Firmicutes bacterium]|jgi:6-phosphogluconate dehydrogenase|nr:NADP-dependent phosphogluconate dehydrogenase [Bacillota bacterium]MDH7495609.1 NADP-dependent phosphogluconate dehydrogenase [Bacillota bacterium]